MVCYSDIFRTFKEQHDMLEVHTVLVIMCTSAKCNSRKIKTTERIAWAPSLQNPWIWRSMLHNLAGSLKEIPPHCFQNILAELGITMSFQYQMQFLCDSQWPQLDRCAVAKSDKNFRQVPLGHQGLRNRLLPLRHRDQLGVIGRGWVQNNYPYNSTLSHCYSLPLVFGGDCPSISIRLVTERAFW